MKVTEYAHACMQHFGSSTTAGTNVGPEGVRYTCPCSLCLLLHTGNMHGHPGGDREVPGFFRAHESSIQAGKHVQVVDNYLRSSVPCGSHIASAVNNSSMDEARGKGQLVHAQAAHVLLL
jgi:hypothetical protein